MSRPRKTTGGPLAAMTTDETAALATVCGVTLTTADAWRHRRPARPLAYRIADALHARDPERWPDPAGLGRAIVEMDSRWPASYRAILAELCRRAGEPEPDWSDES